MLGLQRWKATKFISLVEKTEKLIQIENKEYLFIAQNKTLFCLEHKDKSFSKLFEIELSDIILNYHVMEDFKIVIISKEKKLIQLYERDQLISSM